MALLHRAELVPSKAELVSVWAGTQPWFVGDADLPLTNLAAYRFDDPEGEVGIETLFLRAGDAPVIQVPLTYRAEPLVGAERWLLGTMEHSVLGTRWTYDGTGDPVWVAALATAVIGGGRQADMSIEIDGVLTTRDPTAVVRGSGSNVDDVVEAGALARVATEDSSMETSISAGNLRIRLIRRPVAGALVDREDGSESLDGTWTAQPLPTTLAVVTAI